MTTQAETNPSWVSKVMFEILAVCQAVFNGFILKFIIQPIVILVRSLAELGIFFIVYVIRVIVMVLLLGIAGAIGQWILHQDVARQLQSTLSSNLGAIIVLFSLVLGCVYLWTGGQSLLKSRDSDLLAQISAAFSASWILSERFGVGPIPLFINPDVQFGLVSVSLLLSVVIFSLAYWYKRGGTV